MSTPALVVEETRHWYVGWWRRSVPRRFRVAYEVGHRKGWVLDPTVYGSEAEAHEVAARLRGER